MIYLIRHGQTEFNREVRLQGRLDSPLTELGVEQARRMGRHLRDFIDDPSLFHLISSPLGRAVRTAEIVREASGLDLRIELEPRVMEVSVGAWEGLDRQQIEAVAPGMIGSPGWLLRAPGGETYADVAARVSDWLAQIDETDGRRRIVVSHGVTGRLLRNLYGGGDHVTVGQGASPPQDAVFRLHKGVVGRIDDGWDDDR